MAFNHFLPAAPRPFTNRICLALLCGIVICEPGTLNADELNTSQAEQTLSTTSSTLRSLLASTHSAGGVHFRTDLSLLQSFYSARDFEPAWTGSPQAAEAATRVRSVLADADKMGLDEAQYALKTREPAGNVAPGMDAAIYELTLTDALLRYSRDLHIGQIHPKDVYKDVKLPKSKFDASAALASALKTNSIDSFLADLVPAHPEYRWLMTALMRYRNIAAHGGWPTVSGQSDDRSAAALYSRLAAEDSGLSPTARPTAEQLREAVKRYQIRNGLAPDGVLQPNVIAELNVPVTARIQQILANLERWRWVHAEFENRYVAINVPDQTLSFVQDGHVVLRSRVIVGRRATPTPILRTIANSLIANPPWDIPGDLAANQLLPHLRNNRNYLATHNMIIVNEPGDPRGWNIAWDRVSRSDFPYAIRQLPPNSALGVLMLDAPNKFDVYLHDTPGKSYFRNDDREISNGCIRVEQIMALASLALTNDPAAGRAQLNSAISSHQTRRIMLDNALPIYMLYWTAVADADGNVGFRPDRYHRDPPLIEALNRKKAAQ